MRLNRQLAQNHFLRFLYRFTFTLAMTEGVGTVRAHQGTSRYSPVIVRLHPGSEHNFRTPAISRFRSHIPFYPIICTHTH